MRQNAVTLYVEDSEAESIPTVDLKDFAPPYLFVYGTLMRGEHNEQVMPSGAKFLHNCSKYQSKTHPNRHKTALSGRHRGCRDSASTWNAARIRRICGI